MLASVVPALVSAEGEASGLPMPPIAYALIAMGAFAVGLLVLWTFRNTAAKVADKEARVQAGKAARAAEKSSGAPH